jgi:hypothetical protein
METELVSETLGFINLFFPEPLLALAGIPRCCVASFKKAALGDEY